MELRWRAWESASGRGEEKERGTRPKIPGPLSQAGGSLLGYLSGAFPPADCRRGALWSLLRACCLPEPGSCLRPGQPGLWTMPRAFARGRNVLTVGSVSGMGTALGAFP